MATGLTYVYAIGQVRPFFPSPGIEKELAQVVGRADTAGLTDRQTLHTVLSQRQNRYLARQLCYVLVIEGLETYILQPRISSATPILPARSYASELHLRVHVNRTPPPPKLPFQYTELREYLSAPEMSRYKLTYQYNRLQ